MKIKCSVYIATSLDGFIAKPDGNIDWLHHADYVLEGEDFGYNEFMKSVSALIMGRNTYEKVIGFGKWPYSKPVIVLTSKDLKVPDHLEGKVQFENGKPSKILSILKEQGLHHFYIDGGRTIQKFLEAGLIDQLIITRIPVLLGNGIPLFGKLEKELHLKLVSTEFFKNSFVKSTYECRL